MVEYYITFIPTANDPSEYQHNLFNVLGYRDLIISDLANLHPLLDPTNSFQSIIDADSLINSAGEIFNSLSWYGLEASDDYNNLSPMEIANMDHINQKVSQFYNKNCN